MQQKKQCYPKVEFDQALYKRSNPEAVVRPVSSKQTALIKSPLPPRKPILSQHQYSRQPKSEINTQQEINIIRTRCITPNNKKNLPAIQTSPMKVKSAVSEQKIKFFEKKPEKQQFKITTRITLSAGKRGSKSQHDSPHGAMQFTWLNNGAQIRKISIEKRNQVREKHYKKPYDPTPLCAQDFTMTSHKNELPQLLKMYQQQFSDLSNQVPLNMSEIQEANEEGMSSVAQSTLL